MMTTLTIGSAIDKVSWIPMCAVICGAWFWGSDMASELPELGTMCRWVKLEPPGLETWWDGICAGLVNIYSVRSSVE